MRKLFFYASIMFAAGLFGISSCTTNYYNVTPKDSVSVPKDSPGVFTGNWTVRPEYLADSGGTPLKWGDILLQQSQAFQVNYDEKSVTNFRSEATSLITDLYLPLSSFQYASRPAIRPLTGHSCLLKSVSALEELRGLNQLLEVEYQIPKAGINLPINNIVARIKPIVNVDDSTLYVGSDLYHVRKNATTGDRQLESDLKPYVGSRSKTYIFAPSVRQLLENDGISYIWHAWWLRPR